MNKIYIIFGIALSALITTAGIADTNSKNEYNRLQETYIKNKYLEALTRSENEAVRNASLSLKSAFDNLMSRNACVSIITSDDKLPTGECKNYYISVISLEKTLNRVLQTRSGAIDIAKRLAASLLNTQGPKRLVLGLHRRPQ